MFDAKLNHESRFFSDGYELSGIENVTLSYKNPASVSKFMGTTDGFVTLNGPTNQQVSFSRFLTYNDPVLSYTGDDPISGSIYYNDEHYGFESGYLLDYSLNCAVGSVPRVSTNFQIADELQSGKSQGMDDEVHPQIDIPTQGSISIQSDNASTNRVVGFDYSIKCNRKAYLGVGDKNIIKVESVYPIEYSATVQIDVDDAFMEYSNSFLDKTGERNISINIDGRNGSQIQNLQIPNASLVGESLTSSSNGSLKLRLEYIGSVGKDVSNIDYSRTFATNDLDVIIDSEDSVIEDYWLRGNQDVHGLFFGQGLQVVGKESFSGCLNLDYLPSFPQGLEYIDDGAFSDCENISSDLFFEGNNITGIGSEAFKNCSSVEGLLYLPDSITNVGSGAFKDCKTLNSIRISENLNQIREVTFQGCEGLVDDLNIPNSVSRIDDGAFSGCFNIQQLNIGDGVQYIDDFAFAGCSSLSSNLLIPDSVTGIGNSVFTGCNSLPSLSLGESLKIIGSETFSGCSGLSEKIIFPKSLEEIDGKAFAECKEIKGLGFFDDDIVYFNTYEQYEIGSVPARRVNRGEGLRFDSLDNGVFIFQSVFDRFYNNGVEIVSSKDDPYIQGERALKIKTVSKQRYTVGMNKIQTAGSYYIDIDIKTENCEFRIKRNDNVFFSKTQTQGQKYRIYTSFQAGDFIKLEIYDPLSTAKSVTIGKLIIRKRKREIFGDDFNLRKIGESAFRNCSEIGGVVNITEGVDVYSNAFRGCDKIEKVTFAKDVDIFAGAFMDCTGLNGDIIFDDSTTTIGNYSFRNCKNLKGSLYLPTGLTYLGPGAFRGCKFKNNLILSNCNDLYRIHSDAFRYCNFSNQLELPQTGSLAEIGERAFQGSKFTGDLVLPTGLTLIGRAAFLESNIGDVYSDIPPSTYQDSLGNSTVNSRIFEGATGSMYVTSRYYNDYVNAINFSNEIQGTTEGELIFQTLPLKLGSAKTKLYRVSDNVVINEDTLDIEPSWNKNNTTNSYVDIDRRCKIIGLEAFFGSSMSGSLILPDNLEVISYSAFEGSTFNGSLKFNEKLLTVDDRAFKDCSGFTGSLELPSSTESIGDFAFQNCGGFNGVLTLPSQLQSLGAGSFENMTGLNSSIQIPEGIPGIKQATFKNCNLNGRLLLPQNITYIESDAFENNNFSQGLALPRNLNNISNRAFKNCSGITSLTYSNNRPVNLTIGNSAFEKCVGIVEPLRLKTKVGSVGVAAFKDCSGIYNCYSNIPETRLSQGSLQFQSEPTSNRFLYVNAANINSYRNPSTIQLASPNYYDGNFIRPQKNDPFNTIYYDQDFNILASGKWDDFRIPNQWELSGDGSFLDIGESISSIGRGAFQWNNELSGAVRFPDSLSTVDNEAFRGCNNVENYILNNGVQYFGYRTFAGNSSIQSWTFPESVVSILNECFVNNFNLKSIVLPGQSLLKFGQTSDTNTLSVVRNCHDLEYVNIGNEEVDRNNRNGVIKRNAFNYCGRDRVGVGEVIIQGSIDQIGVNCFDGTLSKGNYPWIKKATVRARVVKENAFINQTNMTEFNLTNKLRVMESGALANCSSLESFRFRGHTLGSHALSGCSSLSSVVLQPDFAREMEVQPHAFRYAGGSTASPGLVKSFSGVNIRNNAFRNSLGNPWIRTFDCDARIIGTDSFRDQTLLEDVTFGTSSRNFYARAFKGCTGLTGDLNFTRGFVNIGNRTFDECPVRNVYFNTNRGNISGNAFDDMTGTFYVTSRVINSWTGESPVFDNGRTISLWTSYPELMP